MSILDTALMHLLGLFILFCYYFTILIVPVPCSLPQQPVSGILDSPLSAGMCDKLCIYRSQVCNRKCGASIFGVSHRALFLGSPLSSCFFLVCENSGTCFDSVWDKQLCPVMQRRDDFLDASWSSWAVWDINLELSVDSCGLKSLFLKRSTKPFFKDSPSWWRTSGLIIEKKKKNERISRVQIGLSILFHACFCVFTISPTGSMESVCISSRSPRTPLSISSTLIPRVLLKYYGIPSWANTLPIYKWASLLHCLYLSSIGQLRLTECWLPCFSVTVMEI